MKLGGLLRSRFLRDSSVLQVGSLFVSLGNFVGTIALTHVLGAEKQGEFYLAIAIYSFLWFSINLGLYAVTISQVAAATARGSTPKVAAWMAWATKASLALGALAALLAWTALPPLVRGFLGADVRNAGHIALYAGLLAFSPLVELPRVVCCAGLEGTRRMLSLTRVENGQEATRVFLVVVGALVTDSPLGPVLGMLLASGLGSVFALDAYRRERRAESSSLPPVREVLRRMRDVPITHGLRLGLKMGLVRNVDAFGVQILPALVLGRFGSPQWVAYLRIAQRLVDVARLFMKGISRTALPVLSELAGVRDRRGLRRVYWRATLLSGITISAGLLCALPFVRSVVDAWFPRDYRGPVWTCFLILLPGTLVVSFSVANDTFYLVTNTLRVGILFSLLGLVVNTAVLALLTWRMPTVGAAYGLSFTFLWSLVHIAYAYTWFRRHAPHGEARPVAAIP